MLDVYVPLCEISVLCAISVIMQNYSTVFQAKLLIFPCRLKFIFLTSYFKEWQVYAEQLLDFGVHRVSLYTLKRFELSTPAQIPPSLATSVT